MSLEERKKLNLDFSMTKRTRFFNYQTGDSQKNKLNVPLLHEQTVFLPMSAVPSKLCLSPLSPKLSELDQQAYRQGFVDALFQMHKNQVASIWMQSSTMPSFILTPASPFSSPVTQFPQLLLQHNKNSINGCMQTPTSPQSKKTLNFTLTSQDGTPEMMYTLQNTEKSFFNFKNYNLKFEIENRNDILKKGISEKTKSLPVLTKERIHYNKNIKTSKKNWKAENSSSNLTFPGNTKINKFYNDQENLRLERRREKNRSAARKCRTKKLERITTLEEKIRCLNEVIERNKQQLISNKEMIEHKEQYIAFHKIHGCPIESAHRY